VEAQIDVSAGGNITTATGLRAGLNNSGTITNSYGCIVEGISGYTWTYGFYADYCTTGAYFKNCTTAIQVGASGTGAGDVYFYSDTSGAYVQWDQSADQLKMVTVAARALSGEEHAIDLTHGGTLSSGDSMVGVNIATTPSGTGGLWVAGIFAKVTQGATKTCEGYLSAAEFELNNECTTACAAFPLVLNYNDSSAKSMQGQDAYIALRDYGSNDVTNLFWLADLAAGTTSNTTLFTTAGAGYEDNCDYAIKFVHTASLTPYWILVSSTGPGG